MMSTANNRLVFRSVLFSACAIACLAMLVQAQYNGFDSDSNSELGKLVRNSGRAQQSQRAFNQQAAAAAAAAMAAATRDAHSQPLSYGPSHSNRRNYGSLNSALNAGYGPMGDSIANARGGSGLNSEIGDDDEGSSYGPGLSSNFGEGSSSGNDDGEGSSAEGPVTNLNQAASGYPSAQHDFNGEGAGAGFNFDGANFGSEFGPESSFGSEGKRAKSASSPVSSKNYESDDDAALPAYGPNSAINADGEEVVDGRAGYAPAQNDDNDNDDE